MSRDIFNPGDVLTAAELQAVQDQGVIRFASDAERDAQWPAPPDGARCAVGEFLYRYQAGWKAEQAYLTCAPGASTNPIPPSTAGIVLLPGTPDWTPQVFENGLSSGAVRLKIGGTFRTTLSLVGTATGADAGSFLKLRQLLWRGGQAVWTTESVYGLAPVTWHQASLEALLGLQAGDELQWTVDNASPVQFQVDNRSALMMWQVR